MKSGTRDSLHTENVWLHNEVSSSKPRFFARDFSNYYTFPNTHQATELIVLGDHQTYMSWDGPRSVPPQHTWAEGEMLPENLVGTALNSLSAAQRSTYKVVRSVSEVECMGFFDSVNAYDNAFVSLGPCHWTLGIVDGGSVSKGELCGYLSYLRSVDATSFSRAVEFFGARVDEDWASSGVGDGRKLFDKSSRKYAGWIALQQEGGTFGRLAQSEDEGNYLKTWHWFYRFVMAGRTINGFRRRMWHMARVRLRDILSAPWGTGVAALPSGQGATRPATIGDVYTSEKALALILRWHIRFPAHICSGGRAGSKLRSAFTRAKLTGNPTSWGNTDERALIQGIMDEVAAISNSNFTETMNYVNGWPNWTSGTNPRRYALESSVGSLATNRNSLQFDNSDLPPAPPA